MNITDYIIGVLLMNAIPHYIFGITKSHFLGLFGFSPTGNILYAILQFIAAVSLFSYQYGLDKILENGFLMGGITVLILFFIFGKFLVDKFQKNS